MLKIRNRPGYKILFETCIDRVHVFLVRPQQLMRAGNIADLDCRLAPRGSQKMAFHPRLSSHQAGQLPSGSVASDHRNKAGLSAKSDRAIDEPVEHGVADTEQAHPGEGFDFGSKI